MKIAKCIGAVFTSILVMSSIPAYPQANNKKTKETVYVPAYSSILHGNMSAEMDLAITFSIHNIDLKNSIIIDTIDYYDSKGNLLQKYIGGSKIVLKPMETYNLGIKQADIRGGIGANFIVKWHSETKVNRPIIETVMIGTSGQQGISFTSRGETIEE